MNIYKIVHIPTGKTYIGQTISKVELRLSKHKSLLRKGTHSNPKLQAYFSKYGESEFLFTSVAQAHSLQHLNQLEKNLIRIYKADVSLGGFNIREGGANAKMAESTKLKISLSALGNTRGKGNKGKPKPNKLKGIPRKEETKLKVSLALKGHIRSEESKQKGAISHYKKVNQLSLAGDFIRSFDSLKEAAQVTGANKSLISLVASDKKNSAGGYKWERQLIQQSLNKS